MEERMLKVAVATLVTLLMACGTYATTYGVTLYLASTYQKGAQPVIAAATIDSLNFTLPTGHVNATETANIGNYLNVTTNMANLKLQITCLNAAELSTKYYNLTLTITDAPPSALVGDIDLLSTGITTFTLPNSRLYKFNYEVQYTPIAEGCNTIELFIDVIQ